MKKPRPQSLIEGDIDFFAHFLHSEIKPAEPDCKMALCGLFSQPSKLLMRSASRPGSEGSWTSAAALSLEGFHTNHKDSTVSIQELELESF